MSSPDERSRRIETSITKREAKLEKCVKAPQTRLSGTGTVGYSHMALHQSDNRRMTLL
ncbi:hypothetical protein PSCICE_48350 [Pseudomonas cichorii]|nr:hypothetical protein PSCICE_48350 [Pseudomonas cichorii]GFM57498.1 hypothetical protein PSCICF_36760 [Pseudomonas cichorii]GFM63268.1 hypothetical protein PSCICG_44280 [Pseudomonas cichorii]